MPSLFTGLAKHLWCKTTPLATRVIWKMPPQQSLARQGLLVATTMQYRGLATRKPEPKPRKGPYIEFTGGKYEGMRGWLNIAKGEEGMTDFNAWVIVDDREKGEEKATFIRKNNFKTIATDADETTEPTW